MKWNKVRLLVSLLIGISINSIAQEVWTRRSPLPIGGELNAVTKFGNQVVAVGYKGAILTSSDALNWSTRSSGTVNRLNSVAWTGTQLVTVGQDEPSSPPQTESPGPKGTPKRTTI
jgi:hypothetical protein